MMTIKEKYLSGLIAKCAILHSILFQIKYNTCKKISLHITLLLKTEVCVPVRYITKQYRGTFVSTFNSILDPVICMFHCASVMSPL